MRRLLVVPAGLLVFGVIAFVLGFAAQLPFFTVISLICLTPLFLVSLGFAFALEAPTLGALSAGWVEVLYAGVFSTAIAFTLQAIGQQHVPPANAAIILSAESLFAAIGGAVIMGERLPLMGYAGAGMIFCAILLVEAVPAFARRRHAAVMDTR